MPVRQGQGGGSGRVEGREHVGSLIQPAVYRDQPGSRATAVEEWSVGRAQLDFKIKLIKFIALLAHRCVVCCSAAGLPPKELVRHPSAREGVQEYGCQDAEGDYRGPQAGKVAG